MISGACKGTNPQVSIYFTCALQAKTTLKLIFPGNIFHRCIKLEVSFSLSEEKFGMVTLLCTFRCTFWYEDEKKSTVSTYKQHLFCDSQYKHHLKQEETMQVAFIFQLQMRLKHFFYVRFHQHTPTDVAFLI